MPQASILLSSDVDQGHRWAPLLRRTVRATLRVAEFVSACEVSIRLTDDETIRSLNRQYRNMDHATDVLSFSMLEGDGIASIEPVSGVSALPPGRTGLRPVPRGGGGGREPVLLGDLVISLQTAARRAHRQGWPLEVEMALLAAHGVLHLLGYDHQQAAPRRHMRARERQALVTAGFDPQVVGR